MNDKWRVQINRLATGVPGLDRVLGGGLPEYSFNLIAGGPGTGKTTLVQQMMFHLASPERPALYFTVLGEPPIKMLRYQQQYSFFDVDKVDRVVHYINLSDVVLQKDLSHVLAAIVRNVEQYQPGIVVVDSFRTVVRVVPSAELGEMDLQTFVQRLALYLTSWQAVTFLVGEYVEHELRDNPVFTVADGILWLTQSVERNSMVRKLQVMKLRGQAPMPGLHTFRISVEGIQVFPRILRPFAGEERGFRTKQRISTGITGLDEMMGGGPFAGESILVAGPSGSGKTVMATQFVAHGVQNGEPGVIAVFEEHTEEYLARAKKLGFDLQSMVDRGMLKIIYLRPLDLSVDETLLEIRDSVVALKASRVVIDSLSGFELALAPTFRQDFRESLYRMVGALTGIEVTILMTIEVTESFDVLRFSPHEISFLADDIILQRYMELDGQLRRWITVIKMRASEHSKDLREYEITGRGMLVGKALEEYRGVITGVPLLRGAERRLAFPGLTEREVDLLQTLIKVREGSLEAVAKESRLKRPEATQMLDRLIELNYVIKVTEKGKTVYRPVVRLLGM